MKILTDRSSIMTEKCHITIGKLLALQPDEAAWVEAHCGELETQIVDIIRQNVAREKSKQEAVQ